MGMTCGESREREVILQGLSWPRLPALVSQMSQQDISSAVYLLYFLWFCMHSILA